MDASCVSQEQETETTFTRANKVKWTIQYCMV